MTKTLTRMERDGLITRRANPADGRSRVIYLTQKARALEAQAKSMAQSVNANALDGLSDDQIAAFLAALRQITANLQAER